MAALSKLCDDADIPLTCGATTGQTILTNSWVNGDQLLVECVLPSKKSLEAVEKNLARHFRLTPINRHLSCFLIRLQPKPNRAGTKLLLFSGDAPANRIMIGLKTLNIPRQSPFAFVDLPHHGSKNNDPATFFRWFAEGEHIVNAIGISTNGSTYGHPDTGALMELAKFLKNRPETTVLFSHDWDRSGLKWKEITEILDGHRNVYCANRGHRLPVQQHGMDIVLYEPQNSQTSQN